MAELTPQADLVAVKRCLVFTADAAYSIVYSLPRKIFRQLPYKIQSLPHGPLLVKAKRLNERLIDLGWH